jgi:1-aminocyclopropane-1-carboxylate deaminase/D-cysteine desulfhydrase-like pyridoxal-dependent ACC family enzyme
MEESELRARLAALPRLRLAALPTPLDEAPRLSQALGGPRILIKRDDLTGVAFGGNKIREFEYSVAPAVAQGCDVLVNSAGAQSNQSRQTVAVAVKLGMRSVIIASKDAHATPIQGNLLLSHLLGAEVHMADPANQRQQKEAIIERLRREGHRPYDTGYDGAVYRSIAYVDGFLELWDQLRARGIQPDALYLCSGGHTHVGLVVAAKALGIPLRIVGIPYHTRQTDIEHSCELADTASEAADILELDLHFGPEDFESHVKYTGPGYGIMTGSAQEAIRIAARTESLILDPVYTGKAMAGLMAHIREGQYSQNQTVVFLHTGGTPGLFAYNAELELGI